MEINLDLDGFEENKTENIVPKEGVFLGLDISKNSTGVCIYNNGERITFNIYLSVQISEFLEVTLRRELKSKLLARIKDYNFDLILIEDAFQGENPKTTRLLYALNTAIDELILDGLVSCKQFIRVSNQSWKSWLSLVDTEKITKGYSDKFKIETCLGMVGITETGEGFQDRLDATGLIVGYFLRKSSRNIVLRKDIVFSDVCIDYGLESGDVLLKHQDLLEMDAEFVNDTKWTQGKILAYLNNDPRKLYITREYVKLGNLGSKFGLPYLDEGGILMFWLNPKKLSKYIL